MKQKISIAALLFIFSIKLSAQVQWSQLGSTGFNAPIYVTSSDASGNVYAAGNFTNSGGKRYIAMWNGSAWSELGGYNGLSANGAINTICIDGSGNIYAGGSFKNNSNKYFVAKWNGSSWSELGGSNSLSANGVINSICVDVNGNVYAAGDFSNSNNYRYVAKWDGTSWSELGGTNNFGANAAIFSLRVDQLSNLYAAGDFTNTNGHRYIAVCGGYSGGGWGEVYSPINYLGLEADSTINSFDIKYNYLGDDVFAAGLFTNGSGKKYVAKFHINKWDSVVSSNVSGDSALFVNATSIKSLFREYNGYLYAAFNHSGRCVVGIWNGTNWSELGGKNSLGATNDINSVCSDINGYIYAAGNFTNSGGSYYVAKYGCTNYVTPTVTLGNKNTISSCSGSWLSITAMATNPGTSPIYAFYVNGILAQQTSSNTYTDNAFMDNDSVYCELYANNTCQTLAIANSNTVRLVRNSCTTTYSYNKSICSNNNYLFNGAYLNQSGTYFDTLVNAKNADSIVILNLRVNPISTYSYINAVCDGDSLLFNGRLINSSGIYKDTLLNYLGCDSFMTLTLQVNPISNHTINQSICSGSSFFFNGHNLNIAGTYHDTFQNYLACDSFITLNLSINSLPTANFTLYQDTNIAHHWYLLNQCSGKAPLTYSWSWGDGSQNSSGATPSHSYSTAGTYKICVTITDSNGCGDSYCYTSSLVQFDPNSNIVWIDVVKKLPNGSGMIIQEECTIKLYPNPTDKTAGLFLNKNLNNGTITVLNLTGQIILKKENQKGQQFNLDFAQENQGIYFIEVKEDNFTWRGILVKE